MRRGSTFLLNPNFSMRNLSLSVSPPPTTYHVGYTLVPLSSRETLQKAVIDVVVETSGGCRLGSNALGERGKPAEVVGREAAEGIMEELNPIRCADRHLQDQLIIYMALGGGEILTGPLTSHTRTQIWLAGKFIEGLDFKIKERGELTLVGCVGGRM